MKKQHIASLLAAAFVAAPFAAHAENTIEFNGDLVDVTCTIVTSTNGDQSIPLGTLPVSAFAGSAPVPAGQFQISITGCNTSGTTVSSVTPFFASHGSALSINPASGNMKNTSTDPTPATNVELQLVNATTSNATVLLNQGVGAQAVDAAAISAGAATSSFKVQYVKTGAVGAGKFSTGLTYSLTYN